MDQKSRILILGAGTFGLSTAYHLARSGYTSITILEKSPSVPSLNSAGNDLNKIVRAEYEDPFYAELALQAISAWRSDPVFAPYFHPVGYLLANSPAAPEKAKRTLAKSLSSIQNHPAFQGKIEPINQRDDIRRVAPAFDGPMDWQGYFNANAGYAEASDALRALYAACAALGVTIHAGDGAKSLLYDGSDKPRCTGAVTESGQKYASDLIILTLGASLATVLPQIGRQVSARAWPIAHIQLTPDEAEELRNIPVTYARDIGFFFEPDRRSGLLKLSPSGAGYTNYTATVPSSPAGAESLSIPPENNDFIPEKDVQRLRNLLRQTLPRLADRPFVKCKMCWCADSADSDYVIDYVPGKNGLIVVTGDSGHGFKMLPIAGRWVKDLMEKDEQDIERWRWKQGLDAGGEVSWRVGKSTDLGELGPTERIK